MVNSKSGTLQKVTNSNLEIEKFSKLENCKNIINSYDLNIDF